jgi:hypothetical protein
VPFKQNPFSLYDFLGYFIPGAVFVSSVFCWGLYEIHISASNDASTLATPSKELINFLKNSQWISSFILIIASYIFGFAMSLASGIIVEKYLLLRKGYPSRYRFKKCDGTKGPETPVQGGGKFLKIVDNIKQKIAGFLVDKIQLLGLIYCAIAAPIAILDFIFGRLIGLENTYYKVFKDNERQTVENAIRNIFSKIGLNGPADLSETDYNWHKYIYHYIYENNTSHATKIQNYVALYGFARTVSMVFVFIFWTSIFAFFTGYVSFSCTSFLVHLLLFSILSYIFFLGFTKFYRRYTDEILMAAVAMNANHDSTTKTS